MTIEHVAVIALAVEVAIMVRARFGTERRHWDHHKRRGPAPLKRDDITLVSGVLYGLAAVAMVIGAVTAHVEWTLSAIGTFALFGILLPAFAANSVMVMATRGRPEAVSWWQRGSPVRSPRAVAWCRSASSADRPLTGSGDAAHELTVPAVIICLCELPLP